MLKIKKSVFRFVNYWDNLEKVRERTDGLYILQSRTCKEVEIKRNERLSEFEIKWKFE